MKTIFTVIALLSLQTVFAQDFTVVRKGDENLSQATAKIISVKPICPKKTGQLSCMTVGSNITVQVGLNGCVDGFGGYFSRLDFVNGKTILYFGAINLGNRGSLTSRCVQQSVQNITIYTPFEGEVELVDLDFTGALKN